MSYHHRYKQRDFRFAQQLVTLRKRTGLTQIEVALLVDMTEKSIRNWEGGSHYPSDANLRRLVELYLDKNAFEPGHERDEVHAIWGLLGESTRRNTGIFDEQWLGALLNKRQERSTSHEIPPARPSSRLPREVWSETLDVSSLYGRTDELAELERWLLVDRCRVVALLGMGGIGKTSLAVKLAQQVAPRFDCVLWHSLHNAPSLADILSDWLPALVEQHDIPLLQSEEQSLALLIKSLQGRRCLLVLDNLETLFQEGMLEGGYREGYEGYATLILHLAGTAHQSCLVLTSRELFPALGVFTGEQSPVRVFRLGGLGLSASQEMLQDKGLFGKQAAWEELVHRYAGNPLALKIVAEAAHELFGGDIATFLGEGLMTFHGIRQLLTQQFGRLSALEQELIYWLAIERDLVSLEELCANVTHVVSRGRLLEALISLRRRCLIERGGQGATFALQPVVLEYVTERLVEQMSHEILELHPELLLHYALLKAQAKEYIRTSQVQLILQPLLTRLLAHLRDRHRVEECLERLTRQLRTLSLAEQGYGGGNIVNLLACLNGDVRGKDFSHLAVRQAYLQGVEAQDTSFVGSDLTGSIFTENFGGILSVAFSPNGIYLAMGGETGQVSLRRVKDGAPLFTVMGHTKIVWSLAFSPDSTLLASGGHDSMVKVWEVGSGQCLRTLAGHSKWVRSVTFHPDGNLLASGSDDGSIRLWESRDGTCIQALGEQKAGIWSLAFSPDGTLLVNGRDDGKVQWWNVGNSQCVRTISAHTGPVSSVAFTADGTVVVSGSEDGLIRVWEAASGQCLRTLHGHRDRVRSVAFSSDGVLVSGSHDGEVKLWRVGSREEDGQCLRTLHGHTHRVWSVAFAPSGLLAFGSHEGVVQLWQVSRRGEHVRCLRILQGYVRSIRALAFSPDGSLLVCSENRRILVWEVRSGRCLRMLQEQMGNNLSVVFGPDGRTFASGSDEGTVKVWDVRSGHCLRTLKEHAGDILSVTFSADGALLASSSIDLTVKLWNTRSGQCVGTFPHTAWPWSVAFGPGGILACGCTNGEIKSWDVENGQCLKTLQGSQSTVGALTFSADGNRLISSSDEEILSAWEVNSGQCLWKVEGHKHANWLQMVTFSQQGDLLAICSRNQAVEIWEADSGARLGEVATRDGQVRSLAFSPDGSLLAVGDDLGIITLWEIRTGNAVKTFQSDRPYERMKISGVTGISEVQRAILKDLGAIDQPA